MFELPLVSSVISECDRVIGTKRPDWDHMIIGMQNGQRPNMEIIVPTFFLSLFAFCCSSSGKD